MLIKRELDTKIYIYYEIIHKVHKKERSAKKFKKIKKKKETAANY